MYSIQHYVIKFVSYLWQVGGFLWVPWFSSTNKTDRNDSLSQMSSVRRSWQVKLLSDRRTTIFFRTKCPTCSVTGSMIYIFWACAITRNKPIKFPVLNRHMTCMMFQLKYIEGAVLGKSLKRRTILSEDEQNQRKKKYEENRPDWLKVPTKTGKKGDSGSSTMNSRMWWPAKFALIITETMQVCRRI